MTTTADSGPGSLREAITQANADCTGIDNIEFGLTATNAKVDSTNYYKIAPTTPLPPIVCPVDINGYSQPATASFVAPATAGAGTPSAGSPLVELSGEKIPQNFAPTSEAYPAGLIFVGRDRVTGEKLAQNPDGSTVRGLLINQFPRHAVYVYGADRFTFIGNYLGTDPTGSKSWDPDAVCAPSTTPGCGYANSRLRVGGLDNLRLEASSDSFVGTTQSDYAAGSISASNRNVFGTCGSSCIGSSDLNEAATTGYASASGAGQCTSTTPLVPRQSGGCRVPEFGAANNVIQGNYIGFDKTGTRTLGGLAANGTPDPSGAFSVRIVGIFLASNPGGTAFPSVNTGNVVGGLHPGMGNVIAATIGSGISVADHNNKFLGNIIGLNVNEQSVGVGRVGGQGMLVRSGRNIIERNVLANADSVGIAIVHTALPDLSENQIWNNVMGTNRARTLNAPNFAGGIFIAGDADRTRIESNVIVNSGATVPGAVRLRPQNFQGQVRNPDGVSILSNSIYDNTGIGIDLATPIYNLGGPADGDGVTLNDPVDALDGDTGPNSLQNFPVLNGERSFINPALVQVRGSLDSKPNQEYLIQVFSSALADPSGYGEGQVFIGELVVTTDGSGHVNFNFPAALNAPAGSIITSTATDLLTGDTSEFSAWVNVDKKGSPTAY